MSIKKKSEGVFEVRWWEGGRNKACENIGGQGRNRTADAGLFRAALYQLSYLAMASKDVGV